MAPLACAAGYVADFGFAGGARRAIVSHNSLRVSADPAPLPEREQEAAMTESTVPIEAELTLFRPKFNKVRRRTAERYRCALASAGTLCFPGSGETMTAWLNNLSVT